MKTNTIFNYGHNFEGADLSGQDFSNINLYGANLRGANLRGANLHNVGLYNSDLTGADLTGADLTNAWLGRTITKGTGLIVRDTGDRFTGFVHLGKQYKDGHYLKIGYIGSTLDKWASNFDKFHNQINLDNEGGDTKEAKRLAEKQKTELRDWIFSIKANFK
jgi:hypothetical protein